MVYVVVDFVAGWVAIDTNVGWDLMYVVLRLSGKGHSYTIQPTLVCIESGVDRAQGHRPTVFAALGGRNTGAGFVSNFTAIGGLFFNGAMTVYVRVAFTSATMVAVIAAVIDRFG